MSIHQLFRRLLLALGMTIVAASTASAQPSVSEPEFVPYTNDLQFFEQPDLSRYGNGVRAPEGWFGTAEYLNWAIQAPDKQAIGNTAVPSRRVYNPGTTTANTGNTTFTVGTTLTQPNLTFINLPLTVTVNGAAAPVVVLSTFTSPIPVTLQSITQFVVAGTTTATTGGAFSAGTGVNQINSMDTGLFSSDFTSGGRFEFGRMVEGRGWMVSTFNMGTQDQSITGADVSVNFANGPIGFVDIRGPRVVVGPGTFNNNNFLGDGYDDDLDGDGVYGRFGRDRGTQAGNNILPPLDGIPDPENPGAQPIAVDYDDAVPLPTVFQSLTAQNKTSMYGVEVNRLWRLPFSPNGGTWEVFLGPRYLDFKDEYNVTALGVDRNFQYFYSSIADAAWNTQVENNILGGQIGGRWLFQRDRWGVSLEGRFLGAANFQNMKQTGQVGSRVQDVVPTGAAPAANATVPIRDDVLNMQLGNAFGSAKNDVTFAPLGEIRAKLKYQVFRSVYVSLGYSAMYADGIARASKLVNYNLPNFGILEGNNRDGIFVNGLDLGLIINR